MPILSQEAVDPNGDPSETDAAARILSQLAVSALLDEAELTPKPALVDARGGGAHLDLDLARLRRSARSLAEGFFDLARAAAARTPSSRLRAELGRIGREMEVCMLAATGGSNAHRGAIWALGLLVAGAAMQWSKDRFGPRPGAADAAALAAALARLPDERSRLTPSHGQAVCGVFGVGGARGEARDGFPHAVLVGLPVLRASRAQGAGEPSARLNALMAIMSRLDDTCLLYRGGRGALDVAKAGARAVLEAGGASAPKGLARLHRLHDELMARWASPGGSGDLLAVTLFLDRLETPAWSC